MHSLLHSLRAAVCVALLVLTRATLAAPAAFVIDPAQSQVTLSGSVLGAKVLEQGPGSLSTPFGGTILAHVTASTIQFPGGSVLDAAVSGEWSPLANGAEGKAPADFAAKLATASTALGAFRNIVLDLTSPELPLTGDNFDSGALAFGFPANSIATLDYSLTTFLGPLRSSLLLSGLSTNKLANAATLTTTAAGQTLTINVDTEYKFKALVANDSTVRFVGKLVATRTSQPVISAIGFADGKLRLTVQGAGAAATLEGSPDLKLWKARVAERTVNGTQTVFTLTPAGVLEFLRLKN